MNMNVPQKSFNLVKEVSKNEEPRICYLGTKTGMVTLRGKGIENAVSNPRYNDVFELLSIMESQLDKEIKTDINLSYIGLEALVKVFLEVADKKLAFDFFIKNISAKNFFYMINDIDTQQFYHGSDRIYTKFLSYSCDLRALNDFYNEFEDYIEESYKNGIPTIYAFVKRNELSFNEKYEYSRNIGKALEKDSNNKEKMLAFNLINEYYFTKMNSRMSDSSKEELFYKVKAINDNWDKVMNKTSKDYYCLDALHTIATK